MKYLAPNGFTAASLLCGLASIVLTVEGRFVEAAWFALYCVLLDKADGFAARLLRAQSRFGAEFDSFADQVAFGIAPAVLFLGFFTAHPEFGLATGAGRVALLFGAGAYVIANAARLARFNITATDPRYFQGIPTTLVGGLLCALFLTCVKYGALAEQFDDPRLLGELRIGRAVLRAMPLYLLVCAALMVSHVRLPKLSRLSRRFWNNLQLANIALVYVVCLAQWLPEYLLANGVVYLVGGVVAGRRRAAEDGADADDDAEEAGAAR